MESFDPVVDFIGMVCVIFKYLFITGLSLFSARFEYLALHVIYIYPEGSAAGDITIIWNDVFK